MPLLPRLVSPEELRDVLGDERVRVFDATVFLRRAVDGGPYTVESGYESYTRAHLPGAAFADIPGALSDPASPYPFTLPPADHFAAQAGRLGIGDGSHVVAYAQDTPMWATRLWWLLRYFGHEDTSVLDGGLPAWTAAGGPATNRFRPPAELAAALAGGGVRADQPVVAYCGGGISATVDLFALALAGRDDARLYDGSLTEWSAHPDLPLVTG